MLRRTASRRLPRHPPESPLNYALSLRGVTWGNEVTLLPGGDQAFPRMLEAIAAARHEVLLESYIFADDATGREFLAALGDAARRGCTVRLMCDGIGSFSLPRSRLAELEHAGGQALIYRPVAPWRRRWGFWRRDHRKLLAVDGEVGFIGGLNIADEYDDRRTPERPWRDMHMCVRGPAAAAMERLFVNTWNGESERARQLVPTTGLVSIDPRGERPRPISPDAPPLAVQVVGNMLRRHRTLIARSFLYAVSRATRSVYLANPYFIPDRHVSRALRRAVARGVDVRVVIPARSDILLCDLASRAALPALLRDGVRVAEWNDGMLHAKVAAVDGKWATVGSYNLDHQSLRYNLEATANVFDETVAAELESRLREDFAASVEISLAGYTRRPLWRRVVESLAYELRSWL